MPEMGGLYTLGIWKVKQGREREFIDAWQEFADWTTASQSGAGEGILLQSDAVPGRFISFGPWEDTESISRWRASPMFTEFVTRARGLCEEMEPQNMTLVGRSRT